MALGIIGGTTLGILALVERPGESSRSPCYSEIHAVLLDKAGQGAGLRGRLAGSVSSEVKRGSPLVARESGHAIFAFTGNEPPLDRELLAVEAELERRLEDVVEPEDLSTAGVFNLLVGRSALAIHLLERAAEASPSDGRIRSDLSVAYMEQALEGDEPHLLVESLNAALLAVEAKSAPLEAQFNVAVALEELALWREARKAWMAYLDLDPSSAWAVRARRRLDTVDSLLEEYGSPTLEVIRSKTIPYGEEELDRLVAVSPYQARRLVELELLPNWAEAFRLGQTMTAEGLLASARRMGRAINRIAKDPLIEDSVGVIGTALEHPGSRNLAYLIEGHRAHFEGLDSTLYEGCSEFASPLSKALRNFRLAASPFEGWAAVELAICHYYGRRYDISWRYLARANQIATAGSYPNLAARTLWISGLVAMVQGDLGRSLTFYEKAVHYFELTGESQHATYLHALIAKDLRLLGAPEEAWLHRIQALRERLQIPGPDRQFTILQEASQAVAISGRQEATEAFLNELVAESEADTTGLNSDLRVFSLLERAKFAILLGKRETAGNDLQQVSDQLKFMSQDLQLTSRLRVDARVSSATLVADKAPLRALESLESAITFYRGATQKSGERIELLRAYRERVALLRKLGNLSEAESDLVAAITEAERHRSLIEDPDLRLEHQEHVDELYAEMIELQLSMNQSTTALRYVEQSRAWRYLGLEEGGAGVIAKDDILRKLLASLPEDVGVLVYEVLDTKVALWILTQGSIEFEAIPVSRLDLQAQVQNLRIGLRGVLSDADLKRIGGLLFDALMSGSDHGLRNKATLIVMPNAELLELPFGWLFDSNRDRYLFEDYVIVAGPTLKVLAKYFGGRSTWQPPTSLLAVADPAFDRVQFPRLARLPGALRSARSIEGLLGRVTILAGPEATKSNIISALGEHEVLHFSGHSIANPMGRSASGLLVAFEGPGSWGSGDDLITPQDLASSDLDSLELVVLEGCRTALGQGAGAEAVSGLAGTLIAAGVPNVIGTGWELSDEQAERFSRRFYQELSQGYDPATALQRLAVRDLREGTEGAAREWSVFTVFGRP